MKIQLSEQQLNNLMVFLDRSGTRNFEELQAMNEILQILQNPIQEEEEGE